MGYALIAIVVLVALGLLGRVVNRRLQPASFPASDLLRRTPVLEPLRDPMIDPLRGEDTSVSDFEDHLVDAPAGPQRTQGITVKLQPHSGQVRIAAPGAPNTDVPTDRHVSAQGTATITRRTGRRRSTTC